MNEMCFCLCSSSVHLHPCLSFAFVQFHTRAACTHTKKLLFEVSVRLNILMQALLSAGKKRGCGLRRGRRGGAQGGGDGEDPQQRREEATVSHVLRHSWCDWAAWVSARWVTEGERKMKGCGRVQCRKKRRILVKPKAGQWQMEIQGDWYACHRGKCKSYELGKYGREPGEESAGDKWVLDSEMWSTGDEEIFWRAQLKSKGG